MACAGATCGDVELMEIPLSLPHEVDKDDAGDVPPSNADNDGEEDDEEAGLLGSPKSRPSRDAATASCSTTAGISSGASSFLSRLPKGEAVMFCGTFILAFQNIVAKTVERNVPPMQVVFIRSAISGSVTFGTIYQRHRASPSYDANVPLSLDTFFGDRSLWHLCAIRGVVGSIAFSLSYISLTYLTVGDSVAIFFLNPIFSAFLAWPVLGEAVGAVEAAAIICGLIGTLLIVKPPAVFGPLLHALGQSSDVIGTSPNLVGVVITLFSAMCCSVAMVTIRVIGKRVGALSLAGWFHACSTIMGAASMLAHWPLAPVSPSNTEWALLLLLAMTSFFGQLSLNFGYSNLPTLTASAMYYLMVVWSAVLGVLVMREGMDAYGACGAAVICVGGLGPSVNKARLKRRDALRRTVEPSRVDATETSADR